MKIWTHVAAGSLLAGAAGGIRRGAAHPRATPAELPPCDAVRFERLVKLGFGHRRKQLRKLLAQETADWPGHGGSSGDQRNGTRGRVEPGSNGAQLASVAEDEQPMETLAQDVHGELFDVVWMKKTARSESLRAGRCMRTIGGIAPCTSSSSTARASCSSSAAPGGRTKYPRCWDSSAAGHVNAGQEYDATAERELEEELGVQAALEQIGSIPACVETGWEFVAALSRPA